MSAMFAATIHCSSGEAEGLPDPELMEDIVGSTSNLQLTLMCTPAELNYCSCLIFSVVLLLNSMSAIFSATIHCSRGEADGFTDPEWMEDIAEPESICLLEKRVGF